MFASAGTALFYAAELGSPPMATLCDGLHSALHISYGAANTLANIVLLAILFIIQRSYIGIGTFLVVFIIGPFVNIFSALISGLNMGLMNIGIRLGLTVLSTVLIGVGIGYYVAAEQGYGALEGLVKLLCEKKGLSFFAVKIIQDISLVVIGVLLGAAWGPGTFIAMLLSGPVLHFSIKVFTGFSELKKDRYQIKKKNGGEKMKKLLTLTIVVLLTVSSLAGCAGTAGNRPPSGTEGSFGKNVFGKEPKDIGIVMIVNQNLGDKSFCDLSNEGLLRIAADYGCRVKTVELGGDATKQVPTMIEFAENPDWDIIIGGTYNILESMRIVAEEFPEQKFILYDASDSEKLPNIYSVEHMQNEGSFVVGAAAALLTSSTAEYANNQKTIGFVGGSENTAINDFLVGYIQGARYVEPDCKVLISYIGDFRDSAKGKEMAIAQINQGADVIFAVAGGAGLGVLDACREKNVYAIGVDSDQATILEDTNPEMAAIICTSMLKNVDKTVYSAISSALEGSLPWGMSDAAGLKAGSVGMARNKFYEAIFTAEQRDKINEAEAAVTSGTVVVETAVGMDNNRLNEIRKSVSP
jgi:basic membrane protein A